jgi:WD40 repeat protein
VLSGSGDRTIKLWDAATGALLRTFQGHSEQVNSVAFSPDGARVLSGSSDKTVKLWDAATGALIRAFERHHDDVSSVAFSADGARVLSGSRDKTLKLWDAATGALIRTFEGHSGWVNSVAFSADGARVLSGSLDKTLKLWDAATGALIRTFEGHPGAVGSVAFSADGARVLSGSWDSTIKLWDAATGVLIRTFEGHRGYYVYSVAFSADGARVLSGSGDKTLKLWDAATGALIRTFEGHSGWVNSVAFSADGARVLSGSDDRTIKLWGAATGALIRTFEDPRGVNSVAFSPDGARVLSGSGDRTIKLWDVTTGALIRTFEGHPYGGVKSVAFSPDGARVLSGAGDRTIKLWDAATGALIRNFEGHSYAVSSVAFSPDGTRVLSGSWDRTIKLWDAATGALIRNFEEPRGVDSVAFSPDGARVLSGSPDRTIKLWDATTGALIRTFDRHSWQVSSVAFSADGARVLSGSWDKTLKLWDAATGALIRTFEGHSGRVNSVAFSADDRRIVSGSSDTTTRIWDIATGMQLAILIGGRDGQSLAMTPAGFFSGSGRGPEGLLHVVRGSEALSAMQFYDQLYRPDLVEEALKGDPEGKYKDAAFHLNLEKILDSGPTPRIEHLEKKTERAGETVKLAVSIVDTGGGVGPRVVWRVNGQTQGRTEPEELKGAQTLSLSAFTLSETFRIDPSKENTVELTTYNGSGLLATPPLRITVHKGSGIATTEKVPRMHVLAIGVDEYRMADLKLKYAVNDTLRLAKALEIVGSTLFAKVETTILTNEQVAEGNIGAAFDRIGATAKTGDVFVLFLAGHGKSVEGRYYYYPQTLDFKAGHTYANGIGQDKWQAWLAKVGHVEKSVLILDTCESGAAATLVRGNDSARLTAMDQLKHATGHNLIAASRQAAFEGYKDHGVLTYALLEALHKSDGSGGDDSVRVGALADHINGRVPKITQELFGQPQWPIRRLSGIDFPIGIRQKVIVEDTTIPKGSTHFLIRPERVRPRPAADAQGGRELSAGFEVRVIESEAGWAAIARDGERLGYVPAEALLKRQ